MKSNFLLERLIKEESRCYSTCYLQIILAIPFSFPHIPYLNQVVMDVVFNHTAEGNENGPIISFRGIDNSVYYMLAPKVLLAKVQLHIIIMLPYQFIFL